MTTLTDLLRDFQTETKEMAQNQFTQKEEYELLLEDYIEKIKARLIG